LAIQNTAKAQFAIRGRVIAAADTGTGEAPTLFAKPHTPRLPGNVDASILAGTGCSCI
jgi:hypothetical protein